MALLGRNGVGKSTTLKAIMGLVQPNQGRVFFEGQPITGLPPHRLARLGIGYVPEERRIFRYLTVTENLRTGLDRHGVSRERKKELLDKVYEFFPVLAERRNQAGGTLSGGEQQMLAIARAMMLEPKIILLDEPTEGLMPRMVSQIREIIAVLHRENVAVLLVEQNVPLDPGGLVPRLHPRKRDGAPPRRRRRTARRRPGDPPIHGRLVGIRYSGTLASILAGFGVPNCCRLPSPPACGGRGRGPVAAATGRVRWATAAKFTAVAPPTSPNPLRPQGRRGKIRAADKRRRHRSETGHRL